MKPIILAILGAWLCIVWWVFIRAATRREHDEPERLPLTDVYLVSLTDPRVGAFSRN